MYSNKDVVVNLPHIRLVHRDIPPSSVLQVNTNKNRVQETVSPVLCFHISKPNRKTLLGRLKQKKEKKILHKIPNLQEKWHFRLN